MIVVKQVGKDFQVIDQLSNSLHRVIATFHGNDWATPQGMKSLAQRRAEDYCSRQNALHRAMIKYAKSETPVTSR